MSKAKHVPAPWSVEVPDKSNGFVNINMPVGFASYYGPVVKTLGKPTEEAIATARVIAASPEMYELLKSFISAVPTDGTWNYAACVDKAIRIIKKIEQ